MITIPKSTKNGIRAYADKHIPPGGFIRAVLENDLMGSFHRADVENKAHMTQIVAYVYNEIPANIWGSVSIVKDWIAQGTKTWPVESTFINSDLPNLIDGQTPDTVTDGVWGNEEYIRTERTQHYHKLCQRLHRPDLPCMKRVTEYLKDIIRARGPAYANYPKEQTMEEKASLQITGMDRRFIHIHRLEYPDMLQRLENQIEDYLYSLDWTYEALSPNRY